MKTFLKLAFLLLAIGCGDSAPDQSRPPKNENLSGPAADEWTEKMKEKILADFNQGTDSSIVKPVEGEQYLEVNKFRKGELKLKQYQVPDGRTVYEAIVAGDFELRREYCGNGQLYFEGINRKGDFYGLSTWWYCDGKPKKQGLKYRSKLFGKWREWNEDGTLDREDDYGLMQHLDSLNQVNLTL